MKSNTLFVFFAILSSLVLHGAANNNSIATATWSDDLSVSDELEFSRRQKRGAITVFIGKRIVGSVGDEAINRLELVNLNQNTDSMCNNIVRSVIAGNGCLAGIVLGAGVGTVVPGLGNFIGGVVGLVAGCGLGGAAAGQITVC